MNPSAEDLEGRNQAGHIRSELHERFSSPLYPLAFVLIAVAFAGQARSTRQNRMEGVVLAFLIAALCRGGGLAVNNLVVLHAWAAVLMYLLPIAAMLLALVVIRLGAQPRIGAGLFDRLANLRALFGWVRNPWSARPRDVGRLGARS